ncbi:hypothetical protein [Beijerinckia mobilis]|uniref:hypothetical protein n=1 Tax=Beijerinckia mobilis TaxID=231434 RepID=UPI0005539DB1|nr:hypothetical protein [Beijerinckia mobilis]
MPFEGFIKPLLEKLIEFLKYKIIVSIIFGLLFSFILTSLVGFMLGLLSIDGGHWITHSYSAGSFWANGALAAFLVLSFCAITIIIYVSIRVQGEDFLHPIRLKLLGVRELKAKTWKHNSDGTWTQEFVTHNIIFTMDLNNKLTATLQIRESDLFTDCNMQTSIVHINRETAPFYKLYVLFFATMQLKEEIKHYFGSEEISSTMLFILKFEYARGHDIARFDGYWFDVENVIYRLMVNSTDNNATTQLANLLNHGVQNYKNKCEVGVRL